MRGSLLGLVVALVAVAGRAVAGGADPAARSSPSKSLDKGGVDDVGWVIELAQRLAAGALTVDQAAAFFGTPSRVTAIPDEEQPAPAERSAVLSVTARSPRVSEVTIENRLPPDSAVVITVTFASGWRPDLARVEKRLGKGQPLPGDDDDDTDENPRVQWRFNRKGAPHTVAILADTTDHHVIRFTLQSATTR